MKNIFNLHHPFLCHEFRSFGILPYSISARKEISKNYFLQFTDDEDIKAGSISAAHFLWYWILCLSDLFFCLSSGLCSKHASTPVLIQNEETNTN